LDSVSRQWSKLAGNILVSKATTEQKLGRNQHDQSMNITQMGRDTSSARMF
jgi:hypothetical protein